MNKETKTAGIVCDNYKARSFKRTLKKNGYEFREGTPPIAGTKLICVDYTNDQLPELTKLIKKMNAVAQETNSN